MRTHIDGMKKIDDIKTLEQAKATIRELQDMLTAAHRTIEVMREQHDKDVERAKEKRSLRDEIEFKEAVARAETNENFRAAFQEAKDWIYADSGPYDRLCELEVMCENFRDALGDPDRKSTGRPPAISDRLCGVVWRRVRKEGRSINSVANELGVSRGAVRSAVQRAVDIAWTPTAAEISEIERELAKLKRAIP